MEAVAHDPAIGHKGGRNISAKVAKEFVAADKAAGKKFPFKLGMRKRGSK